MSARRITVMQVFRDLGVIAPSPALSWSVGSRIATKWSDVNGEQPEKGLRPKTNGGGTHCFALYPESWRKIIESEIRQAIEIERSQLDLFT